MMGINTIITLDKLIEWSEKWQILFHFGNSLHTGHGYIGGQYNSGDTVLGTITGIHV